MKKLLLILIFISCLQSWTKADDIRDFEIESLSIGDSLLKHYNKDDIELAHEKKIVYSNKKFYDIQLDVKDFEIWPTLQFSLEKDDNNFKIHSLAGGKFMSFDECEIQKKKIVKDLKGTFFSVIDEKEYEFFYKNIGDGKSIAQISDFSLSNGRLRVYCTDWSNITEKEKGYADSLRLEIGTTEYFNWLNTKAYKN